MTTPALLQIGRKSAAPRLIDDKDAAQWHSLRPRNAHLYVENKCNLRCEHCYESEETHPGHVRVSLEDYELIFDGLAELGVFVVTLSGGEPFLRRDFLDLVALARKKRFAVRIFTSGTLIDERKADRLRELNVTEVHISVYSHDPEVHDQFTGTPGSHARSMRAIRLLREREILTVMKTTVMTINVDHLDELVEIAKRHGVQLQLAPDVYRRNSGDGAPLELAVSSEALAEKVFSRPELVDYVHGKRFDSSDCHGDGQWKGRKSLCGAAKSTVTVGADGKLYPCSMFQAAGGDTREHSLVDIWYRSRLFDTIRRRTFQDMHHCPTCQVRGACNPCMAYGEIENGDWRACNTTSRTTARGVVLVAEQHARAERKMARGRPLPLLGDTRARRPNNPHVYTGVKAPA